MIIEDEQLIGKFPGWIVARTSKSMVSGWRAVVNVLNHEANALLGTVSAALTCTPGSGTLAGCLGRC